MAIERVERADWSVRIRNVLVSVFDKRDLDVLVEGIRRTTPEVRFYSTGGTYARLREILGENAERLVRISDYTGQPEMRGGLVKTLDYKIYLGILSETYNPDHTEDLDRTGATPIDMVVVNLYPFGATVARVEHDAEDARGNIDIGGPCMLRAAAKNYLRCTAVSDPADYARIVSEIGERGGSISFPTRLDLAKKAFATTGRYDGEIAAYFGKLDAEDAGAPYTWETK